MTSDGGFGMRRRTIPAWFSRAVKRRVVEEGKADSLATALFSLDEPWRGRFLALVANLATRWAWGEGQPTQEEVTGWLGACPGLYQKVRSLLSVWRKPGGDAS